MDPRHSDIGRHFHEAMELRAEARSAFLTEHCDSDEALREEVEKLLQAAAAGGDLFPSNALGSETLETVTGEMPLHDGPGSTIDRCKLLQQIEGTWRITANQHISVKTGHAVETAQSKKTAAFGKCGVQVGLSIFNEPDEVNLPSPGGGLPAPLAVRTQAAIYIDHIDAVHNRVSCNSWLFIGTFKRQLTLNALQYRGFTARDRSLRWCSTRSGQ